MSSDVQLSKMTDLKQIETIIDPHRRFPFVQLEDLDLIGENLVSRLRKTRRKLTAGQELLKECQSVFHRLLQLHNPRHGLSTVCYFCGHNAQCSKQLKRHYQSHTKENYKDLGFGCSKLTLAALENHNRRNNQNIPDENDSHSVTHTCSSDQRSEFYDKLYLKSTNNDDSSNKSNLEKFYLCEVCGITSFQTEYETHLKTHETDTPPDLPLTIEMRPQVKQNPLDEELIYPVAPATTTTIEKFECSKCNQRFRTVLKRDKHEKTHYIKFKCCFCNLKFPTEIRRIEHKKSVHNVHGPGGTPMMYRCQSCKFYFKDETGFNYHKSHAHSNEPNLECTILKPAEVRVEYEKIVESEVKPIVEKIHLDPQVEVYVCPAVFNEELHYSEDITDPFAPPPEPGKYKCPFCALTFYTYGLRNEHKLLAHPKFQCKTCKYYFKNDSDLNYHKAKAHTNEIVVEDDENDRAIIDSPVPIIIGTYSLASLGVCDQNLSISSKDIGQDSGVLNKKKTMPVAKCNPVLEFDTGQRLGSEKVQNDMFDFKCSVCGKRYKTLTEIVKHEKSHPKDLPCPECPRLIFATVGALRTHKLRYHPIKCSKCDEKFVSVRRREIHELKHGDKWPCELCHAAFKTRKRVEIHRIKLHPKAQKYTYEPDTSTFQDDPMRKSKLTVEEMPTPEFAKIQCKKCPQTFPTKRSAKIHKTSHGKNWFCELCFAGFKLQSELCRYRKAVHPSAKRYLWETGKCSTFQVADKLEQFHVLESILSEREKSNGLESQNFSNEMCPAAEEASVINVDPLSLVSMDGIKEEIPSDQMDFEVNESNGLVNMEEVQEVVVKPEIEDLIWLKSETE